MVTTIQLNEHTLHLKEFMAGYLGKKYGKISRKEILKDLRDKHDRF